MNTEDKAKQLYCKYRDTNFAPESAAFNAAMEMAQWKDEQLVRAAKNAFCEVCPYGPCPYPVDNGEECKRRFAFGEKVYNNLQEL